MSHLYKQSESSYMVLMHVKKYLASFKHFISFLPSVGGGNSTTDSQK